MLKSFVRGETEWQALTALGARLDFDLDGLHVEEPANAPLYEASVIDVATGLLAKWKTQEAVQAWARVLLATSMIDLRCLEDHPDGEVLLEAVWDAAEGADINDRQRAVAQEHATTG